MLRRVVSAVFLLNTVLVLSQESNIKFKHITVDDGLAHNYVKTICRDSYGCIWFGTANSGVNKYDGHNFTSYKYSAKDTNTLYHNTINLIYEDYERKLWICSQGGLNYYNRELDRLERINTGITNIIGMHRFKNGNFLFCTGPSLNYFDYNKKTSEVITNETVNSGEYEYTGSFVVVSDDQIFIPTSKGLYIFNSINRTFKHVSENQTNNPNAGIINVKTLFQDSKGRIWVGSDKNGIFLIKFQKKEPVFVRNFMKNPENPTSLNSNIITSIRGDHVGNIWITHSIGGDILRVEDMELGNTRFIHITHDPANEYSISDNATNDIFVDDEGTVWIGTFTGGVNYYNPVIFKFDHIKHNPNSTNSLNSNIVNVLYDDGEFLWVATSNGLNQFDPITNTWRQFVHSDNDPNSISSDGVWAIDSDENGNIWVGMWAGGINMFDKNTDKFTHYLNDPDNPNTISSNNVFGLTVDDDGTIWVATMGGGLNKFDPKTGIFKTYGGDAGITTNWTKSVLITRHNEVWVATGSGINIFNKKTERFSSYRHDENDTASISHNGIVALYEDSKGTIWVGTEYGINRFNLESESFTTFTEDDGLANNVVRGILEDNEGNLWISTNKGLSKFINAINDPKTPEFKNYYADDGLQADGFNSRTCCKGLDGKLYFGGTNGYNVFDPSNIRSNPNSPKIVLTDFKLFNKSVAIGTEDSPLKKNISVTEHIKLSYKQSVIQIEYAALNLLVPEKNQYAYIMKGFEEEWNYVGTQKFATYTNLSPGWYTFKVKASNNDGVWNEEGISLHIRVTPPFWRRAWFIAFVIISIILSVIRYIQKREEKLKRDKQILEEKIQAGLQAVEEQKKELEIKDSELQRRIESEEQQNWYNEGLIKVSEILSEQKDDLSELSWEIIAQLTKYLEVQQGAIYLLDDEDENNIHLTLTACYAPDKKRIDGINIDLGEGQIGTCFNEKKVIQIDNLPNDYATLSSGLGEISLTNLTLIPIQLNEMIIGVIEFLSFEKMEDYRIQLVQKAGETLTSILSTIKAKEQTNVLMERQKLLTEELTSQDEELRQNLEEMKATQEESARKTEEASKREEEYLVKIQKLEKTISEMRSK